MFLTARWKLAGLWCEIFGLLRTNEKLMDFDQIVNGPNQEASSGQMATILSTMQQLSIAVQIQRFNRSCQLWVTTFAPLYSRSAPQMVMRKQAVVNQYSGTYPNPKPFIYFSPHQEQQLAQDAAQRTGLNAGTIQALPILVPLVLNAANW